MSNGVNISIDLLLSAFIAAATHAAEISDLIRKAHTEKRDVTAAEVQAVFDDAALARAKLTIDIAAAKAAGK